MQILIVDDEPLARSRIGNLLDKEFGITNCDECKNGEEAISYISTHHPDIVFLDIQMPDKTGFDVIRSISNEPLPVVVFVTAYDQFAVKAFDVCAVDYLLKPFEDQRFVEAYHRAIERLNSRKMTEFNKKLGHLMDHYFNNTREYVFQIKQDGWIHKIGQSEISHIESLGNYVKIHVKGKFYVDRSSMISLEKKLDGTPFLRVHRFYLVNTEFIQKITYKGNNEYKIRLKTNDVIVSGRAYKSVIVNHLEMEEHRRKMD